MSAFLAFAASSFGCVMGLAPLLQTRLIVLRGNGEGISITYPAIIAFGALLWVLYGISISNWFLIVPNIIGTLSAASVIVAAKYFGSRKSAVVPTAAASVSDPVSASE